MIRIFLTNLGKYTEGTLVGKWVNLPTENGFDEHLKEIGINENYEEWFITDYETDIDGLKISEYDNIEELDELAEALEDMNEYDKEVIGAMLSEGFEFNEAIENKDNCMVYYNCTDMEDVAREYIEECGLLHDVPEMLQNYFDFEAYGRDMSFEGQFVFTDNGNCVQIL